MHSNTMEGKVIAITGGASGIGLATAKMLSARGATVCIADIDPEALKAADYHFTNLSVPFSITHLDITDRPAVSNWIASIMTKYSHLSGAANCAGIIGAHHGITKLTDLTDEEYDRIIAVNLTGVMVSMRAELRVIEDRGSIVNVSSIQGQMGFPGSAAYVASKHGVIGLTRAAAKEFGHREIRINAVAPGSIMTPLLQKAQEANPEEGVGMPCAIKRTGTAEEIAGIICFLLGGESTYTTGSVYGGDGGWNC